MATEEELAEVRPRLFGMIDESRITAVRLPRPDATIVTRFLALTDLCSTVSDALDELGVGAAIPAHVLTPLADGRRVCGPAITLRYVPAGGNPGAHYARSARAKLADRDLYNVGQPGDVAVFDCGGRHDMSVMGGLSAGWAKRQGIAACIIDGGMRDVDSVRAMGHPVWSRGRTPITGRHRMEAAEINGIVSLAGAQVRPGDLVVADGTGVCVVPFEHIDAVLERCELSESAEKQVIELMEKGGTGTDVTSVLPAERW